VGWLATGTVLDGSGGLPLEANLKKLSELPATEAVIGAAFAVLDIAHRRNAVNQDLAVGRDPTYGMAPDARRALHTAAAKARVAHSNALLGRGALPAAAWGEMASQSAAAGNTPGWSGLLKPTPTALADLQLASPRTALLGYHFGAGRVWGVVWAGTSGKIRDLGALGGLVANIERHEAALRAAATVEKRADHMAGESLRQILLDPFAPELVGQGRFATVAPAPLDHILSSSLPENKEGARWLASIRKVTQLDRFSRMRPLVESTESDADRFGFSYVAFQGAKIPTPLPADGTPLPEGTPPFVEPPDLSVGQRTFDPRFSKVVVAEAATLAIWKEDGPRARVLHFTSTPSSPGGGFQLADGALSLEDIRSTKLIAKLVVISAEGSVDVQRARVRAFLDAGAEAVLIQGWTLPDRAAVRLYEGFFGAVARDRSPSLSWGEAREALLRDQTLGDQLDNPGLWGALRLYSAP